LNGFLRLDMEEGHPSGRKDVAENPVSLLDRTPVSLLDRLRQQPNDADWHRLVDLYTPLLRHWLLRYRAVRSEVDDFIQDILLCVVKNLPEPRPEQPGSFRRWLRVVMAQRIALYWRKRGSQPCVIDGDEGTELLAQLAAPDSPLGRLMDEEHNRYVVRRLMELIEPEFRPKTWRAFQRHALDGLPPAVVASELGISVNAVQIACSRILKRLREEARDFIG
jgi:RNA polymerase sigma-70 factor (ECF subfamily)